MSKLNQQQIKAIQEELNKNTYHEWTIREVQEHANPYIVYKYEFPNDYVYIGRTTRESGRFGNIEKYKGQYVYKRMIKDGIINKGILYETSNIFAAYYVEHRIIEIEYDHSYNAALETGWFNSALKDLSADKTITPEDVSRLLREFKELKPALDKQLKMEEQ